MTDDSQTARPRRIKRGPTAAMKRPAARPGGAEEAVFGTEERAKSQARSRTPKPASSRLRRAEPATAAREAALTDEGAGNAP
jgi:hypothetical protein